MPEGSELLVLLHLLQTVEGLLHALNRHQLPCLDGLPLEHLGKCSIALLADEFVLIHLLIIESLGLGRCPTVVFLQSEINSISKDF